ncbi:MAG: DUF4919 domain-containing protein [Bacteroidetes bacterium]|nr:MAG: DUF4919 domain-containing protein [Bacteroidota bacterium]MBL1145102.1 DUF4919 domain-containing protein [Bacteroidota bacterium]NOG57899.1 DUF4919 domain-containing protein [Bacteroidota bacterium]
MKNQHLKLYLFLTGLAILLILPATTLAQVFNYKTDFESVLKRTKDSTDALFYQNLAKRFDKNDSSLSDFEILALLINYTSNKNYTPYKVINQEDRIKKKLSVFQFDEAIRISDSVLSFHPYNQMILFQKSYAFFKLEQIDSANFYKYKFNRIMDAMAISGSGTFDDAIFSLGSKDSENYIYKRLAKQIMQIGSSVDSSGNFIDVIQITDHQKDTSILYFQIQHAINKLIDTKDESPE